MRLFRLTFATILQRKDWAICFFAAAILPFVLPAISSAHEKLVLVQPARIQAAWGTLWVCMLTWAFLTASRLGEANARSGIGEYFFTTGLSATRQLFELWLGLFAYVVPLAMVTTAVTLFAAMPSASDERAMWFTLHFQYLSLFLLVIAPLLALAIALSSRFGAVAGFSLTLFLTLYGLYGVGYLDNMLKLEENGLLQALWLFSPQYRLADLTQRLYFKTGALESAAFHHMIVYFGAILALWLGFSRLCFRPKITL